MFVKGNRMIVASFCLQELSHELDTKVKKYLRGEGANLEVRNWCPTFPVEILLFLWRSFFIAFWFNSLHLQVLKDKKLKGQLSVREDLYGISAKAAAKAEKVDNSKSSPFFLCFFFFFTSLVLKKLKGKSLSWVMFCELHINGDYLCFFNWFMRGLRY